MPKRVEFGIRLPHSGPLANPQSILEVARHAELFGYDSVWVPDHIPWSQRTNFAAGAVEIVDPRIPPPVFESLSTLAFVAGATQRITLGTAAIVLPLRDPRILAKQVATIHALSGGRLILGLAAGALRRDFEILEVAWEERGALMDDHLAALTHILSPAPISEHHGKHITFAGAEFFPKAGDLAIWFCGMSRPMFKRIARFGQGWLPAYPPLGEYREKMKTLVDDMQERSRALHEVTAGFETFVCVDDRRDKAIQKSTVTLIDRFKSVEAGLERTFVGTHDDIRQRLGDYVTAGASFFELKFLCRSTEELIEMMRSVAQRVLPAFLDDTRRP